jgi:hypothetical protein
MCNNYRLPIEIANCSTARAGARPPGSAPADEQRQYARRYGKYCLLLKAEWLGFCSSAIGQRALTNLGGGVTESRERHTHAVRSRLRTIAHGIAAVALALVSCRPADSVRVAWDAPTPAPKGYRIVVDDRVVMTIPPPPLDQSCSCPTVWVPVPPGEHKITVVAFNEFGDSAPTAITVVRK